MPSAKAGDKSTVRALLATAVLALVAAAGTAHAQDERTTGIARDLFRQGVELSEHGDWAAARDRFERAYALRRSSVVAYNLALACGHVGRLVEALERFEEVRRDPGATPDLREASQRQVADLRGRIGRLTVNLDGPRDGVTLRLDEDALPEALVGADAPADPGHHVVVAMRDGADVARIEIEIHAGERTTASLRIPVRAPNAGETASAGEAAHTDTAPHGGGGGSILESPWLWIGVGAAVAVAVVVIVVVAASSGGAMPVTGDTSPGVLTW